MLLAKTPLRISLFGGGTDFPQWYKNNEGLVISTTIDKYCYVLLKLFHHTFILSIGKVLPNGTNKKY